MQSTEYIVHRTEYREQIKKFGVHRLSAESEIQSTECNAEVLLKVKIPQNIFC